MYSLIFLNSFIAVYAFESLELRVFNGEDLDMEKNGYLVFLRIDSGKAHYEKTCSGSIISANWILTAAHCLPINKSIATISVHQFNKNVKKMLAKVNPKNALEHPLYINGENTTPNYQNDIALLKTTKKIVFDAHTRAIGLAQTPPQIRQTATIAGYGKNELGELMPREGEVKITKCPSESLYGNLLCTFNKVKAGSGDSGGALTSKGKLVGVTAAVVNHCNLPPLKCTTYYANVAAHYSWIRNVTGLHK